MWILTPLQPGGETHYLRFSKEYVVGRKNCDILLSNDQSISRAHAHLTATDQTLIVKDTSKYGTFVNSQRLTENAPMTLKSGDSVTFGVFDSKFSVHHQKPAVCSSCLDNDGKVLLSQSLAALGGKMFNTWSQECTHLVMASAKVTIKTICALLCCRPIVRPEFFSELSKAAEQMLPPPKADSFIPELDEPSLSKDDVNLGVILARRQLFTGKTFIFLSAKQLKRLSAAVGFGGGRSQLLEEGSLPLELLESPQSCVIDVTSGSSQALLSSSTTEWATSVKNIVQRKGLRVIIESEIGLAAIYASCDQHCNPASLIQDAEPISKLNPRAPSTSLSQSVVVDETVLPAVSQNFTAYAVNTEPSQGTPQSKVTGVMAVGETPEKKQNQTASRLHASRLGTQKTVAQCVVADTMSSSFNTVENKDTQRKKSQSKLTGAGSGGFRSQSSFPITSGGEKAFLQRQSPQKQKTSAQASPQKQSTLTGFFKPVNKKRPLEDEPSAIVSEPKRPILESSTSIPNTSASSKETYRVPAATSQAALGSAADLFGGQSEAHSDWVSHAAHKEPQSRKRKQMDEEIQMDELESIMSEDMDCFDKPPSEKAQHAQMIIHSSTDTVEASSKRQRVHLGENGTNKMQQQQQSLERESSSFKNNSQKSEQQTVSVMTEQVHSEYVTAYHECSKPPQASSTTASTNAEPFGDDEDLELLKADIWPSDKEAKTLRELKPVTIKQEVQESKIDEGLPKNLVLVEFRSLTVTAPPKAKPKRTQEISYTKNFKCFHKSSLAGVKGSPHFIGGSDLLVHNRGKNSDLDEWLKDAAEEERQSRRDESIGDDLFRYNPTKLSKRR